MNNDHSHFTITCSGSSLDCFRRGALFNGLLGENTFPRTGVATTAATWTQDSRIQWIYCAFRLAAFNFLASLTFTTAGAVGHCFSWQKPNLIPVIWAAIETLIKSSMVQNLHFHIKYILWACNCSCRAAQARLEPYGDNGENKGPFHSMDRMVLTATQLRTAVFSVGCHSPKSTGAVQCHSIHMQE